MPASELGRSRRFGKEIVEISVFFNPFGRDWIFLRRPRFSHQRVIGATAVYSGGMFLAILVIEPFKIVLTRFRLFASKSVFADVTPEGHTVEHRRSLMGIKLELFAEPRPLTVKPFLRLVVGWKLFPWNSLRKIDLLERARPERLKDQSPSVFLRRSILLILHGVEQGSVIDNLAFLVARRFEVVVRLNHTRRLIAVTVDENAHDREREQERENFFRARPDFLLGDGFVEYGFSHNDSPCEVPCEVPCEGAQEPGASASKPRLRRARFLLQSCRKRRLYCDFSFS